MEKLHDYVEPWKVLLRNDLQFHYFKPFVLKVLIMDWILQSTNGSNLSYIT